MEFLSLKNILMMTPILILVLPVHEFAHGWVAYKMGDPTAKYAGRLTLNPFKHLDLLGVVMMYAVGFGWAKPVPVNPTYFKNRRKGMLLVSLAGPLSNLILGFICMLICGLIQKLVSIKVIVIASENMANIMESLIMFLLTLVLVNINIAVFNLLPVPPLDGSRLLSVLIPEESYYRFARYEQYIGLAFLALVIFVPNSIFAKVINFFAQPIFDSMLNITWMIFGL